LKQAQELSGVSQFQQTATIDPGGWPVQVQLSWLTVRTTFSLFCTRLDTSGRLDHLSRGIRAIDDRPVAAALDQLLEGV
jgi:hypothetical protein